MATLATYRRWHDAWAKSPLVAAVFPADAVIAAYLCVTSIALLALAPSASGLISLHFFAFALLAILAWFDAKHAAVAWLHAWLPVAFIIGGYFEIAPLVHALHPGASFDGQLHAVDVYLVGDPLALVSRHASRGWAEFFTLCYASYFFLPLVLAVSVDDERRVFQRVVSTLTFAFALTFLFYVAVPALGPNRSFETSEPAAFGGYFLAGPLQHLLARLEGPTPDAFPSGHTLITLVVLALAWQLRRWLFWAMLPVAAGLIVATIYLRYHYLADFITALALAPLCLFVGHRVTRKTS